MERNMDDEKQVKDLSEVAKEVFLQEANRIRAEKPKLYDLEEEFGRTRANRSFRTAFLILGFVIVAAGVTVFLTLFIQNQSRRVPVDISDFQDVNLKDLLSSAANNENDLDKAKRALADVQQELATKSEALSSDIAGQIAVLNAQGMSPSSTAAAEKKLQTQESAGLDGLRAQYAPVLEARQADVAAAQKKVDSSNQAQISAARKQEEVLNNQQRLHDIELAQTKAYYESKLKELSDAHQREIAALKENQARVVKAMDDTKKREIAALILTYNPVFTTDPLKALLASPLSPGISSSFSELAPQLVGAGYSTADAIAAMRDALQNRTALYARIKSIPYQNSVPSALAHLDFFDRSLVRSYEDIAARLLQQIRADKDALKARDAQIAQLNSIVSQDQAAFQFYARKIRENGFLVDVRDSQRIVPFASSSSPVSDGDQGLVFRADDEYIGTILFSVTAVGISARQVELAPDKQFQPFDTFLIKKKEGK
ncbi:MAG: hypothetical protein ABSF77_14410 [Spirochaetia bacterium]